MKKLIPLTLTAFAFVNASVFAVPAVQAESYGGVTTTPNCLEIDETVSNPAVTNTLEYVDNIAPGDTKYQPNTTLVARIKVKNTSNQLVPAVHISNDIPQYVTYFAGPGVVTDGGHRLDMDIGDIQAGEEKYYYITYKTATTEELPADRSIICVTNKVVAQGAICNRDEDSSQLCIEKQVLGTTVNQNYAQQLQSVKVAPKAGTEMGLILLGLNGIVGALGFALKKKMSS